MVEEGKFQHLDKWLGIRLEDYNVWLSSIRDACDGLDDSSGIPLYERIQAIDLVQRQWSPYARQANQIISAIGTYIEMMIPAGSRASPLVKAAEERRDLISKERSGLASRILELSDLRAKLTRQYLRDEGIIGDKKKEP